MSYTDFRVVQSPIPKKRKSHVLLGYKKQLWPWCQVAGINISMKPLNPEVQTYSPFALIRIMRIVTVHLKDTEEALSLPQRFPVGIPMKIEIKC